MEQKICSVIVPAYNCEKTIEKCIVSLLMQTVKEIEILIVDDGSTDSTGWICDSLAEQDRRVSVIHQENKGVSAARNAGIDSAEGQRILFVDSDDYVGPAYIEHLLGEADLVIGGYVLEYPDGKKGKKAMLEKEEFSTDDKVRTESCFLKGYFNYVWAKSYKASLLKEKAIRFDPSIDIAEDTLFTCSFLTCCQSIQIVDSSDYHYIKQKSGTLSSRMVTQDMINEIERANELIFCRLAHCLGNSRAEKVTAGRVALLYRNYLQMFYGGEIPFSVIRYMFTCKWFRHMLDMADVVFPDESKKYRRILKTKSAAVLGIYLLLRGQGKLLINR